MTETTEGTLLWEPSPEFREGAAITRYMGWLASEKGLSFEDYTALWEWSVTDIAGFWSSLWDFFDINSSEPYEAVLRRREMPGAEWFPGTELNYAEHVFRNANPDGSALVHASELRPTGETGWRELETRVAAFAAGLSGMGVGRVPAERPRGGRGVSGVRVFRRRVV